MRLALQLVIEWLVEQPPQMVETIGDADAQSRAGFAAGHLCRALRVDEDTSERVRCWGERATELERILWAAAEEEYELMGDATGIW